MGDETGLLAHDNVKFISCILDVYKKTLENVICLVGDNCNTNKALSNKVQKPLVGCASHRYNLAMKFVFSNDEDLICNIDTITAKLRTLLLNAKLKKLTHLQPKTRNVTRWSSTHEMLKRYVELRQFLPSLMSNEIDSLSLNPAKNRRVDYLLQQMEKLESVTKALQRNDTTISDVRAMFDAVVESYPETSGKLSSRAAIVHCAEFESAIVNLQRQNAAGLSYEEEESVKCLRVEKHPIEDVSSDGLSFAERALKRQKCMNMEASHDYMDSRFCIPTSNLCERLFSRVGYALSQRRRGISPVNLESQLFLHFNCDLWGRADISKLSLTEL